MEALDLRKRLISECLLQIDAKLQLIHDEFNVYKEAVNNETKSTAGDKHDTSRSMMQLEQEKMSSQLHDAMAIKKALENMLNQSRVDLRRSIVYTDKGNFFLSVSLKPLTVDAIEFIPVSVQSPIGKLLNNSEPGSVFELNKKTYKVLRII